MALSKIVTASIEANQDISFNNVSVTGNLSVTGTTTFYSSNANNIGIPGQLGFGVGTCPGALPAGMVGMPGYDAVASDNYGNYRYSDGSIMVWIPAFYYKWTSLNVIDIKPYSTYSDVSVANAAGYALHRAFYDGGQVQPGFFIDKYIPSNNGGIASSLKNGMVLSFW